MARVERHDHGHHKFLWCPVHEADDHQLFAIRSLNNYSVNLRIAVTSDEPEDPIITSNFIMQSNSEKLYRTTLFHSDMFILDVAKMENPFLVGKKDDVRMFSNCCKFIIGDKAIFLDVDTLRSTKQLKLWQLLDASQTFEIKNVDFDIFLKFFRSLFLNPPPFQLTVNESRHLMDLYQRFCFDSANLELQDILIFMNSDFVSATNKDSIVTCVDALPTDAHRFQRSFQMERLADCPRRWSGWFAVKYGDTDKKKRMHSITMLGVQWTFMLFFEKVNGIPYLGIGIKLYSPLYRYWRQPADIDITIKTDDSRFIKKLNITREFNYHQSSASCPVVARLDQWNLVSNDHFIVEFMVNKRFTTAGEFPGEKDISLVIGDKKINTSKNLLIEHFDYFKTLFGSLFDDKNKKELVLKDVKYKDMYNMIDVIYNRSKFLTVDELESMLILADRFFCPYIIKYVDIAISDMPLNGIKRAHIPIPLEEKIYFANKYPQLVWVKEEVKRATNPMNRTLDQHEIFEVLD